MVKTVIISARLVYSIIYMTPLRNHLVTMYSERMCIRTLTPDDDITSYLNWMQDKKNTFIKAINPLYRPQDLLTYIKQKLESDSALLLGIFDILTNLHIGNIKYEPIDQKNKYAVKGTLIGDPSYRGIGINTEVYTKTLKYLVSTWGIKRVYIGCNKKNYPSISANKKSGFLVNENPILNLNKDCVEMVHYVDNII